MGPGCGASSGRVNGMELRKKEIVRRTMRDGECFLRFFVKDDLPVVRFLNPDLVKDPDNMQGLVGNMSQGVETAKDDVEEVLAYWYKDTRIPAAEVLHARILVDSDVKRGRSFLEVAMIYLAMYGQWLKDRMKLNQVRSTVALIKRVI